MGLWEFLRQWPRGRLVTGVVVSVLVHVLVAWAVLWGLKGELMPRWVPKKGDTIIVELPKPEEPANAGSPTTQPPPAPRPAPSRSPAPVASRPSPPRETPPPPREERRVASAPRPAEPPAPRAPEPAGTDAARAEGSRGGAPRPGSGRATPRGRRAPGGKPAAAGSRRPQRQRRAGGAARGGGSRTGTRRHRGGSDPARLGRHALQRVPRADPPADQGEVGLSLCADRAGAGVRSSHDLPRRALRHPQGRPGGVRGCRARVGPRHLRRVRRERYPAGPAVPARAGRHDGGHAPGQHGAGNQRPLQLRRRVVAHEPASLSATKHLKVRDVVLTPLVAVGSMCGTLDRLVAQWESASLTQRRSAVRNRPSLPFLLAGSVYARV